MDEGVGMGMGGSIFVYVDLVWRMLRPGVCCVVSPSTAANRLRWIVSALVCSSDSSLLIFPLHLSCVAERAHSQSRERSYPVVLNVSVVDPSALRVELTRRQ